MKTIADFKRAMQVGTIWHTTHKFLAPDTPIKDMGCRECSIVQSNSFAFRDRKKGNDSWSDWPKKNEVSFDGDKVVITKEDFCQLTYQRVHYAVIINCIGGSKFTGHDEQEDGTLKPTLFDTQWEALKEIDDCMNEGVGVEDWDVEKVTVCGDTITIVDTGETFNWKDSIS